MKYSKIHFAASGSPRGKESLQLLTEKYGQVELNDADVVVSLGGDGFLLETLHKYPDLQLPIFGMNRGTLGFLLNEFNGDNLIERINNGVDVHLCPLTMQATDVDGKTFKKKAYNEVSILRYSGQSANLSISVNGKEMMDKLSCDGVLVSTPAGSTAYNLSAHGPVLPLDSNLLTMTPVSPFRPRRWKGALLKNDSHIEFKNLDALKRPIGASADSHEVMNVASVKVWQNQEDSRHLIFDSSMPLGERILREQFSA